MKTLFPEHMELTGKVLDLRLQRQNVVMSNLANINTPNYKALNLDWEDELQNALALNQRGKMSRTNKRHMPSGLNPSEINGEFFKTWQPHVVKGDDSVDLDTEMAKMSKNNMMYSALTTILKKNFEGLKTVISDGGK